MLAAYSGAAAQISQSYAKSHTADEAKAFERLHGQYEMDAAFSAAWQKSLIGPQAKAAYGGAVDSLAAGQRAHIAQEQAQKDAAMQHAANGGALNDPASAAIRRCLELGGDPTFCLGKGLGSGIIDIFTGGMGTAALTDSGPTGVVLTGIYQTPGAATSINFTNETAGIDRCGDLQEVGASYEIHKTAAVTQIILQSNPRPVTLAMRPDGSLIGPGLVDISGQVIIGHHTVVSTQMINGVRAAPGQCNGPCQAVSTVPTYAPKTVRCSIASFAPPVQAAPAPADTGLIGTITGMMGGTEFVPGLRLAGQFSSPSGLLLDFADDAVTLDCGRAHAKAHYTVENTPAQFLVHVQNNGGSFTLAVTPGNTLRGSGSTTVNGRLVSGMNGNDIAFAPHSETCTVGNFTVKPASPAGAAFPISTNLAPAFPDPAVSISVIGASAASATAFE
jgi:hypothetical protein